MALIVGTNSWSTILEADTYFENKINVTEWFTLPDNGIQGGLTKENLLVSAYYWLYNSPGLEIASDSSDVDVKHAQMEAAWFLRKYEEDVMDRESMISSGVTSFDLSKRSEDYDINNIRIPSYILGMLKKYSVSNTTIDMLGEYDIE